MASDLVLDTPEAVSSALSVLDKHPYVAVDCETTGLNWRKDAIVGMSLGVPGKAWYIPAPVLIGARAQVAKFLTSKRPVKVFHNAAFDIKFLERVTGAHISAFHDTLTLAATNDERRLDPSYRAGRTDHLSLDALGEELCGTGKGTAQEALKAWCVEHGPALLGIEGAAKIAGWRRSKKWKEAIQHAPVDLVAPYACMDADLPVRVLHALGNNRTYAEMEQPLLREVIDMERRPKVLDLDAIRALEAEALAEEEAVLSRWPDLLLSSPMQVGRALEARGLDLPKTPTGKPKCDVLVLLENQGDQLCDDVLRFRAARKLRTTYCVSWLSKAEEGCLYPSLLAWATQTGRFSSRDPNFQNVPREGKVRSVVKAPEGKRVIVADYRQIEPRVIAHLTREPGLLKAFEDNYDVYGAMARLLFPERVTCHPNQVKALFPLERQVAKTAVLACFYGAQARKLRQIVLVQAGIVLTLSVCKKIVQRVWQAFPRVAVYVKLLTAKAAETGIVTMLDGRVRHVGGPGGCKPREAFNTLVQGSSAGIMKKAILACRGHEMSLTVHDELHVYTDRGEEEAEEVREKMSSVVSLAVPLDIDGKVCSNWGEKS